MQPDVGVVHGLQDLFPSVESLNSGAFFLSKALQMTLHNQLAGRLLNTVTPVGQTFPLAACLPVHSEEYQVLQQMMASGKEYRDFIVNWEADGRARHVLIDSFTKSDAQGLFLGMNVLMKDLGNFAVLEQKMQKTDKLATMGKVAAGVAHEIRNPLTTIKGFLQMFERRFTDEGRVDELAYTEVMLSDLGRVEALITDLLFLSKPQRIEKSVCSLRTTLEDIHRSVAPEAAKRGIDLHLMVRQLPTLLADGPLLKQAIYNVVKNALEAMEGGGTLGIHAYPISGSIQIDVSDTGPGIPYYLMDKIYDAFFTTKDQGAGLGLPICQRIVGDHGGEIRISSKGFGTTFSFLLPRFES
ncbi:MAG: hypothetical protein A2201_06070 [Alicyclobacillus sp. RIFOXYA1_FULL_53_8]|nr:MAG: hypothetical protein A2201_06070 [Alicyclobacillus sp. RIFOXYA1_FULL_53_8]